MAHAAVQIVDPEPLQAEALDWYNAPAAVDLLVGIVTEPPIRERCIKQFARTSDRWTRYVGERVDRLRALRDEAVCAATGVEPDPAAMPDDLERWIAVENATATVDAVIDAALVAAGKSVVERVVRL